MKHWRSGGHRVILYIDDGICVASSAAECVKARKVVLADLENAGLVLNVEKSHLEPQQTGEWLGFILDLGKRMFKVPVDKIRKLTMSIQNIPAKGRVSVRQLASVVGQIISMGIAFGPIAWLRSRYLCDVINHRWSWQDKVVLLQEAADELQFWKANIARFNGQHIWFSPGATRIAYSDASDFAFGGYVEATQSNLSGFAFICSKAARSQGEMVHR